MRKSVRLLTLALMLFGTTALLSAPGDVQGAGGGGGGGGGTKVDTIKVNKCYYDAPTGEMLIKASSSDPTAVLHAFTLTGDSLGWVQNGGGSRYGGTVMGFVGADPVYVLILSSSGGSIIVPTTPFQI